MEGEFTLELTIFCQSQLAPQDGLLLAKDSGDSGVPILPGIFGIQVPCDQATGCGQAGGGGVSATVLKPGTQCAPDVDGGTVVIAGRSCTRHSQ